MGQGGGRCKCGYARQGCWGAGPLAAQSAIGAKKPGGLGEGEHGHPETVPITPWMCRDHAKTGESRGG